MKEGLDLYLLKRVSVYVKGHKFLLLSSLLALIVSNIIGSLHPYIVKIGVDDYIKIGDMEGLAGVAWLLFIVLTLSFIFQYLFNYIIEYLGQKLLYDMRLDIFSRITAMSSSFFDSTPVGQILTNVTSDVEAIRSFISEGIVSLMGDVLKIGIILILMTYINWRLAIITTSVIPLFALATWYFRTSIRTGFRGVRVANSNINRNMVESLTGFKELTLYDAKKTTIEDFNKHNHKYLKSYLQVVHSYSLYFPVIDLISNIVLALVLVFMHFYLGLHVELGDIYAYFAYVNMIFFPLRNMAEKFNTFQSAMAASERVFAFLDKPIDIIDPSDPLPFPKHVKGKIKFINVNFSYNKDVPILKGINFEIKPGEKVALVGKTGSGKSTIIHLLNRLYNLDSGVIEIDGVDISKCSLSDIRKNITTVPQNMFLFTGSIKENINLFDPRISLKRVQMAAQKVGASHFIEQYPDGYDTLIIEEGKSLSTGQKQLLSFTRALISEGSILLLDEATSSVDSESEKLIEEALEKLFESKTGIIIAHRLSTIKKVDRIIIIESGQIVEEGSHDELIDKQGHYFKLYQMQALAQST